MERDFRTVAVWIARHGPPGTPAFNPPAPEARIAEAERRLGLAFPAALRDLYRLADGQPAHTVALHGAFVLLPLAEVLDAAGFLNGEFPDGVNIHADDDAPIDADPGIRPVWWSRRWIPFAENGGGDRLCADLDPAAGGMPGQVVVYYHDELRRPLVAPGVHALLAELAAQLAAGRCRVADGMIADA